MIVGICRTKNNQAIVEPFIRHNLKFLDRLIVMDNGSVDDTKQILKKLAEEDSRLQITENDEFGDFQSQHYQGLMMMADQLRPRFVVPLDADEFIGVPSRSVFEAIIERIPVCGAGITYWRTYVITPETVEQCSFDPPNGFQWRRKREIPPVFGKAIIRSQNNSLRGFVLGPGNHSAEDLNRNQIPRVHFGEELPLLHFPITSREQLLAKTVVHWMAFLVRDKYARNSGDDGWVCMRNFDRLIKNMGKVSISDLCDMSLMYGQDFYCKGDRPDVMKDPPRIQYERRYSTGESMNALALIAKTWEQSLCR